MTGHTNLERHSKTPIDHRLILISSFKMKDRDLKPVYFHLDLMNIIQAIARAAAAPSA
jgi:hypothetical protein